MILLYLYVLLTIFSLTFPSKQIIQEYERAVIFRMGRLRPGAKGPGLFFLLPCLDEIIVIDQRTISFDVPPQEVIHILAGKYTVCFWPLNMFSYVV